MYPESCGAQNRVVHIVNSRCFKMCYFAETLRNHNNIITWLFTGDKWKAMAAQDRQPFINKAEELRIQHMQTYPDYKYRPRRRPKNKHTKVKGVQPYNNSRLSPSCGTPPGLTPPSTPPKVTPLDIAHIKTEDMGPCSARSVYSTTSYQTYGDETPTEYNNFVFPPLQYKTYYPPCYYGDTLTSEAYYQTRPSTTPPTPMSPNYVNTSTPPIQHHEITSQTSACSSVASQQPILCGTGSSPNGTGQQTSFIQQLIGYDDYKDIQPDEFDQYLTEQTNPLSVANNGNNTMAAA